MATVIGDLAVRIGADTSGLNSGMAKANKRIGQLSRKAADGSKQMAKYGAAAAAAGAAIAAGLVVNSIAATRETANLAKIANSSVSTFQKMAFGAKSVGIENQKLADILKDTSDRVGDFLATGGGPMADFFENIAPKIGVTAEEFRNLSGPQALQKYVNGLQEANLSQSEMTFFMEAIASDATALIPLLKDGGAAMAEQAAQAERLGIVLSDIKTAKIEEAAKQMDKVGEISAGFVDQFTAELSPVITALGKQLVGLTEDVGGVDNAATIAFNNMIEGVALVINAFDRMNRNVLMTQNTIDQWAVLVRIGLLEVAREIIDIPQDAVNQMIMAINEIPGVKFDFIEMSDTSKNITGKIEDSKKQLLIWRGELASMLSEPLKGDMLKRFVADAITVAEASAAAAAAAANNTGGEGGGNKKDEEEKAALQEKLARIEEGNMSEMELLRAKLAEENAIINESKEKGLISEKEWREMLLENLDTFEGKKTDIEEKAADARKRLAKEEADFKRKALGDALSDMSTLMNTESRKMFEIGKAAALSQAIIDGYAAITGAYKVGASIGGPILGAAYGAAAGAATFSQISAIRSQSFGSGGGGSGGSSVTGNINAQSEPVQSQRSTSVDISIIGGNDRDRAVAGSILEQINDEIERGGRISRVGLA